MVWWALYVTIIKAILVIKKHRCAALSLTKFSYNVSDRKNRVRIATLKAASCWGIHIVITFTCKTLIILAAITHWALLITKLREKIITFFYLLLRITNNVINLPIITLSWTISIQRKRTLTRGNFTVWNILVIASRWTVCQTLFAQRICD